MDESLNRYARQIRFASLGQHGQQKLQSASALVCGCGALGTVIANILVRSGVGYVRIVDRDYVEITNLQRQVLFDEADCAADLPKVIAAANKLRQINSTVTIEPIVADVNSQNILALCSGIQCIVDGTDNFETRFLVNDAAHKLQIPWVYGGCIGAEGQVLTILPNERPCLRCLWPDTPPPGSTPTCDTAGVLASATNVVGSLQANEALKILSGNLQALNRDWIILDLWNNSFRSVRLDQLRKSAGCPTCTGNDFPWLSGQRGSQAAVLCGRNAVQLTHAGPAVSLDELRKKLANVGIISGNNYLLRLHVEQHTLTLFPDGRAIIQGTDDIATAKTIYARYVGN
jgi:molybdopterin/thiamine biosynthesis adenylyltransferase